MGFFDWLRESPAKIPLPQPCYDVAYFILPHYAYHDTAKIADLCLNSPSAAGPFFYVMACQARKVEPVIDDAKRLVWHHGELADGRAYFVLEYPAPPPVDMSDVSVEQLTKVKVVLAPHFSAIVSRKDGGSDYYVLGQSPRGGGTTLRHVSADGVNANLGPGPAPALEAFLGAIVGKESE